MSSIYQNLCVRAPRYTNTRFELFNRPEHIRCLMGYVVDLTLILQALFQISLEDHFEGKVTSERVIDIIYEFDTSEKKRRIHAAIRSFVGAHYPFAKNNVIDKIESLLDENEVRCSTFNC